MPGRHRQPVPPRVVPKRLIAAGASGVVTILALAPLAHADSPATDVTTSAAPSTDTPTSEAPSSDAPTSEAATPTDEASSSASSDVPSSATASSGASGSNTPSSVTPSSDASSSGSAGSTASVPTRPAPAADQAQDVAEPNYGTHKLTVAVQQKTGSYVPPGETTTGSMIRITETTVDCVVSSRTCTTTATTGTASECAGVSNQPGSTITFTQLTAAPGFVLDPTSQTVPPCELPAGVPSQFPCDFPTGTTAVLTDGGLPPVVTDASRPLTVKENGSSTISPDSQINRQGAPATSVDVDQPAHGTVTVNQAAAPAAVTNTPVIRPFTLTYTPAKGYVGDDSFRYRVTTANGTSAYVTVTLRVVGAAPTAGNDKDTTTHGDAVRIAVLGNDHSNGGGAVRIAGVSDPKHGSARISGNSIVYTPADDFSGTEKFSYTIASYSGTDTASITVRVAAAPSSTTTTGGAGVNGASESTSTADTGVPSASLLEAGGALLLAGAGATIVGRRRRGGHA